MKEQKTAIITAAGKGMGAAIAKELAREGYALALLSPSGNAAALAESLGGFGMAGSVTEPADLEALVSETLARYGRIDAVVNNTGHPPKGPLLEIEDKDWHAGLDLLLLNVIRIARLVTPLMQGQGGGVILNISTYGAYEPEEAFPVSCSIRAALGSFTKMYADRYARDHIRMNNLLPGFIDSYPESEAALKRIPAGRYGSVEEIAKTAAFLLSDGAGYITGQNIRVDGGLTRSV